MSKINIYKLCKLICFVIMGILVLIFNEAIMNNDGALINGVVGTIIAIYGLEGIIYPIVTGKYKEKKLDILNGGINVLIAIIMIFLLEGNSLELRIVCVMWSLWSIMREGQEILEKGFERINEHPITSAFNFAESIVVIVFSIMLICAKNAHELEHHAHVHVILLGIELIIEVIWIYVAEFEARYLKRIKRRHKKENK